MLNFLSRSLIILNPVFSPRKKLISENLKEYDELSKIDPPPKNKNISVIEFLTGK